MKKIVLCILAFLGIVLTIPLSATQSFAKGAKCPECIAQQKGGKRGLQQTSTHLVCIFVDQEQAGVVTLQLQNKSGESVRSEANERLDSKWLPRTGKFCVGRHWISGDQPKARRIVVCNEDDSKVILPAHYQDLLNGASTPQKPVKLRKADD